MAGMRENYAGSADVDIITGMMPYHQGAIAMAEVAKQYGQHSEVQKLAGEVITTQHPEIAQMRAWLARSKTPHQMNGK